MNYIPQLYCNYQQYFSTVFFNSISQKYFSTVFLNSIFQKYFSTLFIKSVSQLYFARLISFPDCIFSRLLHLTDISLESGQFTFGSDPPIHHLSSASPTYHLSTTYSIYHLLSASSIQSNFSFEHLRLCIQHLSQTVAVCYSPTHL